MTLIAVFAADESRYALRLEDAPWLTPKTGALSPAATAHFAAPPAALCRVRGASLDALGAADIATGFLPLPSWRAAEASLRRLSARLRIYAAACLWKILNEFVFRFAARANTPSISRRRIPEGRCPPPPGPPVSAPLPETIVVEYRDRDLELESGGLDWDWELLQTMLFSATDGAHFRLGKREREPILGRLLKFATISFENFAKFLNFLLRTNLLTWMNFERLQKTATTSL